MPRRTIYVREEDIEVFEEAAKRFGDEGGIGRVISGALREQLRNKNDESDEANKLKMLELCDLPPLLGELVQHRLKAFSSSTLFQAKSMAKTAYHKEPGHFTKEKALKALAGDDSWFDHARELTENLLTEWVQNGMFALKTVAGQFAEEAGQPQGRLDLESAMATNPTLAKRVAEHLSSELTKHATDLAKIVQPDSDDPK